MNNNHNNNRRKPFRREDMDVVLDLLEQLPRIHVSVDGPYTFTDRASDFRALFGADERGARVLAQIHQICDPAPRVADADRHGTLAFKAGMRRVMAEIMLCFVAREPVRVVKQEPTDGG